VRLFGAKTHSQSFHAGTNAHVQDAGCEIMDATISGITDKMKEARVKFLMVNQQPGA